MRASETALIIGATAVFLLFEAQGFPPRYEWSMKPSHRDGMVHFTITRTVEGSHWRHGTDVPLSAFSGLPLDRMGNLHTTAKFEFVRDAGKLLCEGSFNLGHGSGPFTFTPNPAFSGALEKLRYARPTDDQVFNMMMNDVTLEFARFVRDSGLRASTRDLIDLRVHGVKPEYIQEARNLGYADFDARNFIELRIHGVPTELLRELKRVGYNFSAKDITELKIHGVTPDLIAALKSAGYDLAARQITELKIHGVSPQYLRDLGQYGLQPEARDLVQMKIHGVNPDYLKTLKEAGYDNLTGNQVAELRTHGVPEEFILEAKAAGYSFTPKELIELRMHGVNGAYLRKLRDAGFSKLDAKQIAKLKMHGVD